MSTIAAGLTSTNALVSTGDTSGQLVFQTNGTTTAMTIDTSQNVGIGTTSPSSKLQCTGVVASGGNGGVNGYFQLNRTDATNLGSIEWLTSGDEMRYSNRNGGFHSFYTSSTERMRIESNGNVLIGTTTAQGKFTVSGTTGNAIYMGMNSADGAGLYGYNLNNAGYFTLYSNGSNGSGVGGWANSTVLEAVPASTGGLVLSSYTGNMIFQVGARTERMRIDSSGNLLVNTTTNANNATLNVNARNYWAVQIQTLNSSAGILMSNASGTAVYNALVFYNNGFSSPAGYIAVSGSSTAYNTSSDYRLKENIAPMQNALGVVAQLKPVTYTWKADGSDGQGFIAHELQEVVPDCVTGEKDAVDAEGKPVYQGIDTSFLVATLTKAIQEQQAIINELKSRIETLENK